MKKRLAIIVMVTQSVIILLLMMYAFVQKAEAEKQRSRAEAELLEAGKMSVMAMECAMDKARLLDSLESKKAD